MKGDIAEVFKKYLAMFQWHMPTCTYQSSAFDTASASQHDNTLEKVCAYINFEQQKYKQIDNLPTPIIHELFDGHRQRVLRM